MESLSLAVASPVLLVFGNVIAIFALAPSGEALQVESAYVPLHIANRVIGTVAVAMAIAAVVLGILSIAGAWRRNGQSGRVTAIVLGLCGLAINVPVGGFMVSLFLPGV